MKVEIIEQHFQMDIFGFGTTAENGDYTGTAFALSGRMWNILKANSLKNKGKNIWVYESDDRVFTGVELENPADGYRYGLEVKKISIEKHAYYKHLGPYQLIKQVGRTMTGQLTQQGFEITDPYIEIYGHWIKDESKLETELLMAIA